MNTTENNIMIAKFMGLIQSSIPNLYWTKKSKEGFGEGQLVELIYHSDWNWLMEVVNKILQSGDDIDQWNNVLNELETINIEAVYNACVKFIQWYNEQKKSNEKNI